MAGILRLSNTGTGNGQSTITSAASTDTTYTLPSGGGTFVTTGSTESLTVPFALGSASAPSVTFVGDTNTGLYSPGADQVALSTSGVGRVFVDASGQVGIGATPSYYLDVNGAGRFRGEANTNLYLTSTSDSGSNRIWFGDPTSGTSGSLQYDHIGNNLTFHTNGFSERLRITSAGLVGVGTSSPGSYYADADNLVVASSGATGITIASSTTQYGYICFADGTAGTDPYRGYIEYAHQNDALALATAGTQRLLIDSSGRVGIGTSSPQLLLDLKPSSNVSQLQLTQSNANDGWRFHADGPNGGHLYINRWTSSTETTRVTVLNSGNVGIGTTTPSDQFVISNNGAAGFEIGTATNQVVAQAYNRSGAAYVNLTDACSNRIFQTGGNTERARIDSSGRLLVGTSSARANLFNSAESAQFQIEGVGGAARRAFMCSSEASVAGFTLALGHQRSGTVGGNTVLQSADICGVVSFMGSDGAEFVESASIKAEVDGTPGANDMPGRLVFSTTADGASSPTERVRITSGGYLKASNDGTYFSSTGNYHELGNTNDVPAVILRTRNASQTDTTLSISPVRAANSAYKMLMCYSGNETDLEFNLRGDGNAYADGSWNGGGADYAEYFEWSDFNSDAEDRRGISVVLDGDKIREAIAGEDPIGVISGNPSVVGDAAWNKWNGKHLRDEFGSYILDDNGERQLNPSYDPSMEYVSREERPEWDCVGLMGKLRIRKGQVTGSRWIKMRDISDSVEEWLVR